MKKGRLVLEILTIMLGNFIYAVGIVFFYYAFRFDYRGNYRDCNCP